MKNTVYTAFACLCNDLGLKPRSTVAEEALQELRNALLVGSESVDSRGLWSAASLGRIRDCMSNCFLSWDKRYAKPWRPRVFRDIYWASCFVLKVEATYTPEQERIYCEKFLQNEESCRNWVFADFARTELFRLARSAVRHAGKHLDLSPEALVGLCRHGPGAVSEGLRHADKNVWNEAFALPRQLDRWAIPQLFFANEELLYEYQERGSWSYRVVANSGGVEYDGPDCFNNYWVTNATVQLSRPLIVPGSNSLHREVLEFACEKLLYGRFDGSFFRPVWTDGSNPGLLNAMRRHLPLLTHCDIVDSGNAIRLVARCEDECRVGRVVARLSLVPKDWKGPRGVFIHPKAAVWCQLGIWTAIAKLVSSRNERGDPRTWLGYCYDPSSQAPSRELALESSIDRRFATLDLSDASDRIPATLVRGLFHASHWEALKATRASAVLLPGRNDPKKLWMFAPMGDGKTFPILTIVCAALSVATLAMRAGYCAARPPTDSEWVRLARDVRVFGDDIIVPSDAYDSVCAALSSANLRVNDRKSFHRGFFRESCGMDAYRGVCVTPARLRFDPVDRPDVATVQKAIDLHNRICLSRPDAVGLIKHLERYVQRSRYDTGYTANTEVSPHLLFARADQVFLKNWERPRTRFAYNLALQRWEYEVYTEPKDNYLRSENPWWDLNHWLLTSPKGEIGDVPIESASQCLSPSVSEQWNKILAWKTSDSTGARSRGTARYRKPKCSRSWVPVVGCTLAPGMK